MAQERSYDKQSGLQNKIQNLVLDTEDEKSSISHSLSAGVVRVGDSPYVYNKRDREGKDYLGRGSFGLVYKGMHETGGTEVAIKQIDGESRSGSREIEFLSEQSEQIKHENIVSILEIVQGDFDSERSPIHYIVMELCKDGNLNKLFHDQPLKVQQDSVKHDLMCQFLAGVAFLHSKNIAHRDLKPTNILVTHTADLPVKFIAKVSDFGSGKVLDSGSSTMTSSKEVGTPWFKAPEFFQDEVVYSRKADSFSAGLTCLAMLQPLDDGDELRPRIEGNFGQLSEKKYKIGMIVNECETNDNIVVRGLPDSSHLSDEIRKVIKDATEYDPDKRPTVEEMLEWMREIMEKKYASQSHQTHQLTRPKQSLSTRTPKPVGPRLTREPDLVRTEFSKEKTQLYMEQHVASGYLNEFKTQAENSGITDLLSIPIAIVLSCSLYNENKSLPKRTELVEKIIFKTIEKALKKSGVELPKDQIDNLLSMLGKLSWEALLKPSKQLLIRKADVQAESEILLHMGLLFAEEVQYSIDESTDILTFQHRLLQEFTAAFYICQNVMKEGQSFLDILTLDWNCIEKQKEVITFACGLLKNLDKSSFMVDHVCRCVTEYVDQRLASGEKLEFCQFAKEQGHEMMPVNLVSRLQEEAGLPKLNNYFSMYMSQERDRPLTEVLVHSELILINWHQRRYAYFSDTPEIDTVPDKINGKVILNVSNNQSDSISNALIMKLGDNVQAILFRNAYLGYTPVLPNSLRHLHLVECAINHEEICKHLGMALKQMHHLTYLELYGNRMEKFGVYLAEALDHTASQSKLRYLSLRHICLPVEVSSVLLSAVTRHSHLQELLLDRNQMYGCMDKLMQSPPPSLRVLSLVNAVEKFPVGEENEAVLAMSSAISDGKLPNIERLNLNLNVLRQSAIKPLLESVQGLQFPENPLKEPRLVLGMGSGPESQEFIDSWKAKLFPNVTIQGYDEYNAKINKS